MGKTVTDSTIPPVELVERVADAIVDASGYDWDTVFAESLATAALAAASLPDERMRVAREALERAHGCLFYIYETSDDEHISKKAKWVCDEVGQALASLDGE